MAESVVINGRYRLAAVELGSGAQGRICSACDVSTGQQVAAKVFASGTSGRQEAALLKRCGGHPHVTDFVDFCDDVAMDGERRSVLVMEIATGGDLFDRLISGGPLHEGMASAVAAQLMLALSHCHEHGVAHRDVKLENVLLDSDGSVKLADFGLAGVFRVHAKGPERLLGDRCGSKAYAAPELIRSPEEPYEGPPVDVWSAGVCLFAVLANFFPFDIACAKRDWRVARVLAAQAHGGSTCGTLFLLAQRPCHFSPEVTNLLDAMLQFDPARRATVDAVLVSPWINNAKPAPHAHCAVPAPAHAQQATVAPKVSVPVAHTASPSLSVPSTTQPSAGGVPQHTAAPGDIVEDDEVVRGVPFDHVSVSVGAGDGALAGAIPTVASLEGNVWRSMGPDDKQQASPTCGGKAVTVPPLRRVRANADLSAFGDISDLRDQAVELVP